MTKEDSERKKNYSNVPESKPGTFKINYFRHEKDKSYIDPNITYEKELNGNTKIGMGISSEGEGYLKIKKQLISYHKFNEKKELENQRAKQFADYVQIKMIRGHSKEVAEEMAKKIVYTQ